MSPRNAAFLISFFLLMAGCRNNFYKANSVYQVANVNNNVCKKLYGRVTLYLMFVDTRETHPWTAYDINSTLDSVYKAAAWITKKAADNNVPLTIDIKFHQKDTTVPIEQNLYNETLFNTLFYPNLMEGIENLDSWADAIAKKAGNAFPSDSSRVVKTKNVIANRERLIARLRDNSKTDNVVLMYMLNNYHQNEISLAMHAANSSATEYSIVSFKNPAVIAHEFLHIFGALDFYMSPFDRRKRALKSKLAIMQYYPNEIMAFTDRSIELLDISPASKYLLGWVPEMDDSSKQLLFGKKIKLVKY